MVNKLVKAAKLPVMLLCILLLSATISFLLMARDEHQVQQSSQPAAQAVPEKVAETEKSLPPNAEELLKIVNEERTKVGAKPLSIDGRLNSSAQQKADDLKLNNYFEHINPMTGVSGLDIIRAATSYKCVYVSENMSRAGESSAKVVRVWLGSTEGHREAMLNNRYELTGFGISGEMVVQHFCDLN